jgi:hypothetical protein
MMVCGCLVTITLSDYGRNKLYVYIVQQFFYALTIATSIETAVSMRLLHSVNYDQVEWK